MPITRKKSGGGGASVYNDLSGTPITSYEVTTADCENTTDETDIISFTVPADSWGDGEVITVLPYLQTYMNEGFNAFSSKIYVGGVSYEFNDSSPSQSAFVGQSKYGFDLVRNGNTVYFYPSYQSSQAYFMPYGISLIRLNITGQRYITTFTPNFTTDITIKISIQWGTASANSYIRNIGTTAIKEVGI